MLEVRHHSGQSRRINPAQIEAISPDAAGHAVVRMASGVEFTVVDSYDAFNAALDEWSGKKAIVVTKPGPAHPEIAQKGPLAPPTGEQSPALPKRGIVPGAPGYQRELEAARAQQEQAAREREEREARSATERDEDARRALAAETEEQAE